MCTNRRTSFLSSLYSYHPTFQNTLSQTLIRPPPRWCLWKIPPPCCAMTGLIIYFLHLSYTSSHIKLSWVIIRVIYEMQAIGAYPNDSPFSLLNFLIALNLHNSKNPCNVDCPYYLHIWTISTLFTSIKQHSVRQAIVWSHDGWCRTERE